MGIGETNPSLRIPTINFSVQSLNPKTPEWESVRAQVQQALEEFGCFEASFDKVNIKEVFEATKEFFDLPLETKQLNVSDKPFHSYSDSYGRKTVGALPHEAVFIENPNIEQKVKSFANVSWPQGNPRFCKSIYSYSAGVSELDQIIKRMIFESFGIEKHLEDHLESNYYLLRIIKYKFPETAVTKKLGLTDHTDKGYTAILSQNEVDGLEIQRRDGQWISVKPLPGSFIVILGEMLHVLTNGRLHCPVHRVMMSQNEPRYSTVLFSNPKADYLIKTPEGVVDEKHPLMFKPFYLSDYINFFVTVGKKEHHDQSTLRAFCGV